MKTEAALLPEYARAAGAGSWLMKVWVQPGAKKTELAGMYQGSLKIRLAAPAVDNKANTALVEYAAALLGLRKSQVTLESGHASRGKTLRIECEKTPVWPLVTG